MTRTTSLALFIIFAVITYVVTFYGIKPGLSKFVTSGAFNDVTDVRGTYSQSQVEEMAIMHCKKFIADELEDQQPIQFAEQPSSFLKVGDPISGRFLIKSSLELTADDGDSPARAYACQIKLEGGDISDIDNWNFISHRIWAEETL